MAALVIFVVALMGIVGLFGLKFWEMRNGRVLAPALRARLDDRALHLKELAFAARVDLAKLPPKLLLAARGILHEGALLLAALARAAESGAHRLADLVSYKHRFEARETRSEFLRKVSEHRNGDGAGNGGESTTNV